MSEDKNMIRYEAVEAALGAFYANFDVDLDGLRAVMAILEAAAPHMLAEAKADAWDEGEDAGRNNEVADQWPDIEYKTNPYRSQA